MTLEFIVSTHRAHILLVDYCAGKFLLFWFSFLLYSILDFSVRLQFLFINYLARPLSPFTSDR